MFLGTIGINGLIPILLVANLSNAKWYIKCKKSLKPWHMGTHLTVLSEIFLMNTNMNRFRWFFKNLCILVLWPKVVLALEVLRGHVSHKCFPLIPSSPNCLSCYVVNCVHILNNYTLLKITCELLVYKELISYFLVQLSPSPKRFYAILKLLFDNGHILFFQNMCLMSHSKYGNYQLILKLKIR